MCTLIFVNPQKITFQEYLLSWIRLKHLSISLPLIFANWQKTSICCANNFTKIAQIWETRDYICSRKYLDVTYLIIISLLLWHLASDNSLAFFTWNFWFMSKWFTLNQNFRISWFYWILLKLIKKKFSDQHFT